MNPLQGQRPARDPLDTKTPLGSLRDTPPKGVPKVFGLVY